MTDLSERLRALIDRSLFKLPPAGYRDTLAAALAAVDENERLREALTKLHAPTDQEVEVWADGPGEEYHDEFVCSDDPADCRGHTKVIPVCQECGYDHEDGYPVLREWPCPTLRALDESEAS